MKEIRQIDDAVNAHTNEKRLQFFSILYSMKFTIDVKVDWQTKINQKFADDQMNTFNSLDTNIREVFLKLHFYKKQ